MEILTFSLKIVSIELWRLAVDEGRKKYTVKNRRTFKVRRFL